MFLSGADVESATQGAIRLPAAWDVCLQRDCGVLFPDVTRAFLFAHAQKLGAKLHTDTVIRAPIEAPTLFIDGQKHAFDRIIVAAGGWTGRLLPGLLPLIPKRRVVAWFRPHAPIDLPPVLCVDNEVGLYGMPTPDGFYKIGLHSVGDAIDPDRVEEPNAAEAALLSAQAAAHLPLHDPEPVAMKSCIYTMTPDENFLIAPSPQDARVLAFSCCSGHGFKYAPIYGEIALDWAEDRDSAELRAFGLRDRATQATKLGGA